MGFSFSISPSNEYSGLISFRIDWLDLLAVPGTLKNLLQHHSSKASILRRSAFFTVQLSHPYMTTENSDGKASACNAGDWGSIPGSGRSPGEGNGNPLHHSCLENPMDGGTKSRTQLSNFTLTRWTFVGEVMSLLYNLLSRLVITFLPRSKHLLMSWLQSPSAVILEPKKIKSVTVFIVSPFIFHEVIGLDAMILALRI